MGYKEIVGSAKGRFGLIVSKTESAAAIAGSVVKRTGTIIVDSAKSLVEGHSAIPKILFTSAKAGLEKARADGIKAVVKTPTAYLPTTDKLAATFRESKSTLSETGEKILKSMKSGAADIQRELKYEIPTKARAKSALKKPKTKVALIRRRVKARGEAKRPS